MALGMKAIHYENELKQCYATIASQAARIKQLEAEIEELKKLLAGKGESKTAKKPRFTENYSLDRIHRQKRTQGLDRTARE